MNTFNGKTTYDRLVRDIEFLRGETEYLPWKTAIKHATDLTTILEHRRSFIQFSVIKSFLKKAFFKHFSVLNNVLNPYERTILSSFYEESKATRIYGHHLMITFKSNQARIGTRPQIKTRSYQGFKNFFYLIKIKKRSTLGIRLSPARR
jgi:hypothetical protein